MTETLAAIRAELIAHSEPHKLPLMQRFFKEPIDAYCTYTAHVRRIAKTHAPQFKSWPDETREALANALWDSGKFEEGAVAIQLYARILRQLTPHHWSIFSDWLDTRIHNWAHCDALCADILGPLLIRHPDWIRKLHRWPQSKHLYKRRAALVAPLKGFRKGLFRDHLERTAQALSTDKADLIKKAIKWWIRERDSKEPK